ncbi:hypothetical protein WJ97_14045 [Burkholderia ubonensis]|uniref:hypothetical protein n=1 Tax=Burkholderia ubonensis TaxID=101571 RepID=UPI00075ADB78|nr:hypothetical protein [Burkholderia ubonensis]KVP96938.1 hypothetical protein WJ97_14045 [Burkholderia ubonensis]
MNKLIRKTVAGAMAACLTLLPLAQAHAVAGPSACTTGGVAVGFFNGVLTSQNEATYALVHLRAQFGRQTAQGEPIRYETFYNHTNGLEDFVETFAQRLKEEGGVLDNRFELFNEAVRGNGTMLDTIGTVMPAVKNIVTGVVDAFAAFVARALTAMLANPPTMSNYTEHQGRIAALALEGKKMLFFAHSQGNLFVNQAYAYALTKVGPESVKVVHAAPASPMLNGEHTLADKDLVINALRAAGTVAGNTDSIPGYSDRRPGLNGKKDFLGHGLLEIYLNPSLTTSSRLKAEVGTALSSLVAPPAAAATGFISATMTWDGVGDADLHTFEPDGTHVFFGNRVGRSGYLDVDNTQQLGPEHYYSTCSASVLQTGTYRFMVANFSRADGRKVTLQVSSNNDGVLGTATATLGPATGTTANIQLLNVTVTQDPATGQFRASIAQ